MNDNIDFRNVDTETIKRINYLVDMIRTLNSELNEFVLYKNKCRVRLFQNGVLYIEAQSLQIKRLLEYQYDSILNHFKQTSLPKLRSIELSINERIADQRDKNNTAMGPETPAANNTKKKEMSLATKKELIAQTQNFSKGFKKRFQSVLEKIPTSTSDEE